MERLEVLKFIDQVLETKKDIENSREFTIFASLEREYEERLLLDEINKNESDDSKEGGNDKGDNLRSD